MSTISRRQFIITGMAGASAASVLVRSSEAQGIQVRFNVLSAQGQGMLQKYTQAVKLMTQTASGSPGSWVFQWYTHAVRGDSNKAAQLNAVFGPNPSPNKTLATQMWGTCQPHFNSGNQPFFLPWHRMYVYYFERVCRKVLNDPTFSLPYWNYSSPNAAAIPAAFTVGNSPLFRPNRNPGVNQGQPINQGQPQGTLSPVPALSQTTYLPSGANRGFNQMLDLGLHGAVHVLVGNRTNMGDVPWAANDPIFWLHHCNIDRLWASWNKCHKNPDTPAWLNQTFTFADENAKPVTAKVANFETVQELAYTYDHFETVPGCQTPPPPVLAPSPVVTLATATAIVLGEGATRATLTPTATSGTAVAVPPLGTRVQEMPATSHVYLTISNYRAVAQPGVLYHLYLDLPAGTMASGGQGHYVGSMNFFAVVPVPDHEGHHGGADTRVLSFEATDLVKRLKSEGRLTNTPTVTISPAGKPPTAAKPVIGEIALVEQ